MPSIKTTTEALVDVEIDIECMQCGRTLDVYIRDTKIKVECCPKCYGLLEKKIEELTDKISN